LCSLLKGALNRVWADVKRKQWQQGVGLASRPH